jgi:hypothetical protein
VYELLVNNGSEGTNRPSKKSDRCWERFATFKEAQFIQVDFVYFWFIHSMNRSSTQQALRRATVDNLSAEVSAAASGTVFTLTAETTYTWQYGVTLSSKSITLNGAGAGSTVLDAQHSAGFFVSTNSGYVTLTALTLTNGFTSSDFPGGFSYGPVAVLNSGRFSASDVFFVANTAQSSNGAGAVYVWNGEFSAERCHFNGNKATANGGVGGIVVDGQGAISLKGCTFTGNQGGVSYAGAIMLFGTRSIANYISTCKFYAGNTPQACSGVPCPAPTPPTPQPTTASPTLEPTPATVPPTPHPTEYPTPFPTEYPTPYPTLEPTEYPTPYLTPEPTQAPTTPTPVQPTPTPSLAPSPAAPAGSAGLAVGLSFVFSLLLVVGIAVVRRKKRWCMTLFTPGDAPGELPAEEGYFEMADRAPDQQSTAHAHHQQQGQSHPEHKQPPALTPGFLPPALTPGVGELVQHLLQLEQVLHNGQSRMSTTQYEHLGTLATDVSLKLSAFVSSSDIAQLRKVSRSIGKEHADVYATIHKLVVKDAKDAKGAVDSYEQLLTAAARHAATWPGTNELGRRTCLQRTSGLSALYDEAGQALPKFTSVMQSAVAPHRHLRSKRGEQSVKLQMATLKHLYRIIEKISFKPGGKGETLEADSVCDIVRCIVQCDSCDLMKQLLDEIVALPSVEILRVKDRANHITSMNWMDVMVNLTVKSDRHAHVCEIQIVHSKMLVARTGLGGHEPYVQLRAANEILDLLDSSRGRSRTEVAGWARAKGAEALVGRLVQVFDEDSRTEKHGIIRATKKQLGRATAHVIEFETGETKTMVLSKEGGGDRKVSTDSRAGGNSPSKGTKFYLADC